MQLPETRVVLFQVRTAQDKIQRLTETAQHHFEQKEHVMIFVEDDKALLYADELLWKFPKTSFLPHSIDRADWIVLTKTKQNWNQAQIAFNLCSTPLLLEDFRTLYDFEDLTSTHRQRLSQLRFDAYKKSSHLIEAR